MVKTRGIAGRVGKNFITTSDMKSGVCMRNCLKKALLIIIALSFPLHVYAQTAKQSEIMLEPKTLGPGDIAVITVKNMVGSPEGTFNGKKLYWNPSIVPQNSFKAILGIDLFTVPGEYALDIAAGGAVIHRIITISKKKYPVERLKLPKNMVELSPENEARVEREQKKMAAVWPKVSERSWSGDFINPREGKIVTKFGVQRIINKVPKSPHTGVDVSARVGDVVRAPNNGVAVLIDEQFYTGNSIVLDHGQGIH